MDKTILQSKWGEFKSLNEFNESKLQDGRFSVCIDSGNFESLFIQQDEPCLFVLLSGARDPKKTTLPYFNRWSWYKKFPGSILCISDPTLYLDSENLRLGWYIGTKNQNWLRAMAELVKNIADKMHIATSNVISYGSSGGGFASLMLAMELGDSTAVAINPQINILDYLRKPCDHFLKIASFVQDIEYDNKTLARFSVTHKYDSNGQYKFLIVQNIQDKLHYQNHLIKFCSQHKIKRNKPFNIQDRVNIMLYDSPDGHGPEPKESIAQIITRAVSLSKGSLTEFKVDLPKITRSQLYLLSSNSKLGDEVIGSDHLTFIPPGRADVKPFLLTFPIDWSIDPYHDRNWCGQLHMWRMIDDYLIAYDKSQNSKFLEMPLKIILDWYNFHYVQEKSSIYAWMDMMVGLRAMKLAFVIVNLRSHRVFDHREYTVFSELVTYHLDFLLNIKNIAYSNHTFIDLHGLAGLAQLVDKQKQKEIYEFIKIVLPKLLVSQFDKHGVHLENSPGYQLFGINCLKRLVNSQWFSGLGLEDLLAKAKSVYEMFLLPDGRVLPFGDTDGAIPDNLKDTIYNDGRRVFNRSGYAIIRDSADGQIKNASFIALMGAFNSRFHKQSDDLSFIWYEGEDILCDAGKFAYKNSPISEYVRSTRAHNTIEIDNESYVTNYSRHPELVYGSAIKGVTLFDWGYTINACMLHKKLNVEHERLIIYLPKKAIVIIDSLKSNVNHSYTQWFHLAPHIANPISIKNNLLMETTLRNSKKIFISTADVNSIEYQCVRGQEKPHLQGWISQGYAQITPSCALGFTQRGNNINFATCFSIEEPIPLVINGLYSYFGSLSIGYYKIKKLTEGYDITCFSGVIIETINDAIHCNLQLIKNDKIKLVAIYLSAKTKIITKIWKPSITTSIQVSAPGFYSLKIFFDDELGFRKSIIAENIEVKYEVA